MNVSMSRTARAGVVSLGMLLGGGGAAHAATDYQPPASDPDALAPEPDAFMATMPDAGALADPPLPSLPPLPPTPPLPSLPVEPPLPPLPPLPSLPVEPPVPLPPLPPVGGGLLDGLLESLTGLLSSLLGSLTGLLSSLLGGLPGGLGG